MVAWRTRPNQRTDAVERARKFRQEPSAGEAKLWKWLRGRKFDGLKFRRQVPVGPYFADFYCEAHRLVVEVDGGQHERDEQVPRDAERDAYMRANGYRIVRIPSLEVLNDVGASLARIRAAVIARGLRPVGPSPLAPLPLGEG